MKATEGWVGGLQRRDFLYGPGGRTRVSVYREDKGLVIAIEDGALD